MKTKEIQITILFTVLSLIVYNFFPTRDVFQQITGLLVFLVFLPFIFSKYILKNFESIINFKIGEYKKGLSYGIISLLICFLVIYIQSFFYNFLDEYSIPAFISENFFKFLLYEFFLVLPFIIIYEFYFRGFLMGIFSKKMGYWSIPLQSIIFILLTLSSDGKFIQFVPYIFFSVFAGWIALKSKSLIYSATAQFILIFILNVIIIKRLG